jgi:pimeloyl-ACP methyl ester carboxylesterase
MKIVSYEHDSGRATIHIKLDDGMLPSGTPTLRALIKGWARERDLIRRAVNARANWCIRRSSACRDQAPNATLALVGDGSRESSDHERANTFRVQGLRRIGSAPRRGPDGTARVVTAPAIFASDLLVEAGSAVEAERRRSSHMGERPHTKHLLVRTSDGVSLAVSDTGSPTAVHTVVFLHGLCLDQSSWERQISYLLRRFEQSVRVISYDHRGHGGSAAAPMDTYRIDQLADDLAQVLSTLHVTGPLTLVGHSMGGMTALAYLARPAAERPVEPHGLVLVATAAGKLAARGLARLLATPAPAALIGLIRHTPEHALHALVGPVCATLSRWRGHGRRTTLAATVLAALATTPMATAVGFLPGLRAYNQYATLATIHARTVVISGGADPLTPPSHAAEMSAGIYGADLVHLPLAGHMLPQQAPHVINDAIRRTIAQSQRREPLSARRLGMRSVDHHSRSLSQGTTQEQTTRFCDQLTTPRTTTGFMAAG